METTSAKEALTVEASPDSSLRGPVATSFATSSLIQVINILTGALLARSLGPQGRGELAAVLLWPSIIVTIGSLGIVDAAAFHAARATSMTRALVGTTLIVGLIQAALLVVIGAFVVTFGFGNYSRSTITTGYLMLGYIPLNLSALYLMWLLNGFHRFSWFQGLRLCTIVFAAATIVGFAIGGVLTVFTASIAYLAANFITLMAAIVGMRAHGALSLRFDAPTSRKLLRYGIRSHVSNVSNALNERLDQLLISIFLSPSRLGVYVIAVTLSSATSLVGMSVYLVSLPTVARLEPGRVRTAAARRFVALTLAISTIVSLPILLFAPKLIVLFFGDSFRSAANVARVLVVGAIPFSTSRALGAVLKAIGRPLEPGTAEVIALGATLAGLAILLPAFGLIGAAVASLVSYAISMAWMVRRLTQALDLPAAALLLPQRSDIEWLRDRLAICARSR